MIFDENLVYLLFDIIGVIIVLYFINRFILKKNENICMSIKKASFMLAFSIAITSSLLTENNTNIWYMNSAIFILDSLIILALLYISLWINDKVIFSVLNNNKLMLENNISITIVETGTTLATAIILFCSMYGEGSYLSGFIFFIFGQVSLILMFFIFEKLTEFNNVSLIKENNKSVSIVLFSVFVGFSIVIGVNIFGNSEGNLIDELIYVTYIFVFYCLLLFLFVNRFLDKVFFVKHKILDEIINDNLKIIIPYSVIKLSLISLISFIVKVTL